MVSKFFFSLPDDVEGTIPHFTSSLVYRVVTACVMIITLFFLFAFKWNRSQSAYVFLVVDKRQRIYLRLLNIYEYREYY